MAIPIRYNLRHLFRRWRTTLLTSLAIGLVVAVFVIMLSLAQGLSEAFVASGDPRNVLVMRSGSTSETNSLITRDQVRVLQYLPGVSVDAEGKPLVSVEVINLLNIPRTTGGTSNVMIRGVGQQAFAMRPQVQIVEGDPFRPGLRELVVGSTASERFVGCRVGQTVKLVKSEWTIVGRFDAGRSAFDSEIWGDTEELSREFDRDFYSTVLMRVDDAVAREALIGRIEEDQQLASLKPRTELAYYEDQTKTAGPLKFLGMFLAVVMAIGAVFSAMNTMYAAVAGRGREIATLRVLGYSRRSILISFVIESILLALVGGALGGLLSLPMNGVATGTTNFLTFTEVAFQFRVTPALILGGFLFAAVMGVIGGFLPALQASRRAIVEGLRET